MWQWKTKLYIQLNEYECSFFWIYYNPFNNVQKQQLIGHNAVEAVTLQNRFWTKGSTHADQCTAYNFLLWEYFYSQCSRVTSIPRNYPDSLSHLKRTCGWNKGGQIDWKIESVKKNRHCESALRQEKQKPSRPPFVWWDQLLFEERIWVWSLEQSRGAWGERHGLNWEKWVTLTFHNDKLHL